ncbi:unnamed protein product, partial [Prorocentrum cordatum]
ASTAATTRLVEAVVGPCRSLHALHGGLWARTADRRARRKGERAPGLSRAAARHGGCTPEEEEEEEELEEEELQELEDPTRARASARRAGAAEARRGHREGTREAGARRPREAPLPRGAAAGAGPSRRGPPPGVRGRAGAALRRRRLQPRCLRHCSIGSLSRPRALARRQRSGSSWQPQVRPAQCARRARARRQEQASAAETPETGRAPRGRSPLLRAQLTATVG